jgi:hypothetical protein
MASDQMSVRLHLKRIKVRLRANVGFGMQAGIHHLRSLRPDTRSIVEREVGEMASDQMSVRLHLKRIKVLEVVVDDPFELRIVVADTRSVVRCPSCGYKTAMVHDTRDVVVRDVEFGGRPTTLVWRRRRFVCDNWGDRHLEDHPEIEAT